MSFTQSDEPIDPSTRFGYTLSSEEQGPAELVDLAVQAEEYGFDFVSLSDHFHPWISEQGHSPFAWTVLGAIARCTRDIQIGVGVTCPLIRIHPVIVAHAAATTALLSDHRFFLGVGTGEALNEHVVGERWPTPAERREMLEEAVHVMRELWTGATVNHRGAYYDVDNARLFDAPDRAIPVIVSAFGTKSATLAARIGNGVWSHSPVGDTIDTFVREGGQGPRYGQLTVCWDRDIDAARETVRKYWPTGGLQGQLTTDLPTWKHFEAATATLSVEEASEHIPCGPEAEPVVAAVQQYLDAGYDHIYFHQIGPDQEGFFRFWRDELLPELVG